MMSVIYSEAVEIGVKITVLDCAHCGMLYGITRDFEKRCRQDGATFYCPAGHSQWFSSNDLDKAKKKIAKLEQELKWESDMRARTQQRAASAERSLSATKGVVTKLKKRTAEGLCPVCDKTFAVLKKHMAAKHPEFEREDAELAPAVGVKAGGDA